MIYSIKIPQLAGLQQAFEHIPDVVAGESARAINQSLVALQRTAKDLAPVDSGRLRSSLQITPARRLEPHLIAGSLGTAVKYAPFMEQGTGIYGPSGQPITAKNGKFLRFQIGSKVIFAKSVRGSKGRFFMRGALEQNNLAIQNYFQSALNNVTAALARGGRTL